MIPHHFWVEMAALLLLAVSVPVSLLTCRRLWTRWKREGLGPSRVPDLRLSGVDAILFVGILAVLVLGSGRLMHLAAVGWVLGFLALKGIAVGPLWQLSWDPRGALSHAAMAMRDYLALLPWVALTMGISLGVGWLLGLDPDMQDAVRLFMEARSIEQIVGFLFLACVAAPVAEELVFRGLLYPALKTRWGRPAAVVLSSVLFGAIHLHWASFLSLAVLGAVLALVFDATGRLGRAIALHAVFNTVTCALLLVSKLLPPA
jgi:membrane protease YdiL (CAAX protease family)